MSRRRKTIFDLMEDFRKEMDRVFEAFTESTLPQTPMYDVERGELQPLAQIRETEGEVVVAVDLPCVRKEDINLSATEDSLKIEAAMKECIKLGPWGSLQREAEFTAFRKTLRLPSRVDPKKTTAKFKDGILEVKLPKQISGHKIDIT